MGVNGFYRIDKESAFCHLRRKPCILVHSVNILNHSLNSDQANFRLMTRIEEYARIIGMMGVTDQLLQIAKSTTWPEDLREAALYAVRNLACEPNNGAMMAAETETIPTMIQLLKVSSPQSLRTIAITILACMWDSRAHLLKADAIPRIVEAFREEESEEFKFEIVDMLRALVHFPETATEAVNVGVISVFLTTLKDKSATPERHLEALKGIYFLCRERDFENKLFYSNTVLVLLRQLREDHNTSAEAKITAHKALIILAGRDWICQAMHNVDAILVLVPLLAATESALQAEAVELLYELTTDPAYYYLLLCAEIIMPLLHIMQHGTDRAQLSATTIMANLARAGSEYIEADTDVGSLFVKLLATRNVQLQLSAASGLYAFIFYEQRSVIAISKAASGLVDVLISAADEELRAVALSSLSIILANNPEDLTAELSHSTASPPLLQQLVHCEVGENYLSRAEGGALNTVNVLRRFGLMRVLSQLEDREEVQRLWQWMRDTQDSND